MIFGRDLKFVTEFFHIMYLYCR